MAKRKRVKDPFDLIKFEVESCLNANEIQVFLQLENEDGKRRRIWIPRGAIIDNIGSTLCVTGDSIKIGQNYFTIKMSYHYAKSRGLVR